MDLSRRSSPVIPRWFLLLAFVILIGPSLQALLNLASVRSMIVRHIASETGLEAGDLRIRLVPRPRVQLLDVVMRDSAGREPTFRADRVEMTMAIRPLLRKQWTPATLRIRNPRVTVRRDSEGRWWLPFEDRTSAVSERSEKEPTSRVAGLPPVVEWVGGEIELVMERSGQTPDSLRLTDIHLVTAKDAAHRTTDLQVTGQVLTGEQASTLSLVGTLTGLDQPTPMPRAEEVAQATPVSFSGRIEVQRLATREWTRLFGRADRAAFEGVTDVTSRVSVVSGPAGYDLALSQFELRLGWLSLNGEAVMQGIGSDHPRYAATLSSSPFRLGTFFRNMPALMADPKIRALLHRYEGDGFFEVVKATLNGRIGESRVDEWKGIMKLSQGRLVLGSNRVPIQDLSSTLTFDPHTVHFTDVKGSYGPIQISNGGLVLSHLQVAPTLELDASGGVEAGELLRLARETGDADLQQVLRNTIDEASGSLRLSVRLAGGLTPEPEVALVRAEISGQDLEVRTPRLRHPIERLSADVTLTPRAVEVHHLNGAIGPLRFDGKGAADLQPLPKLHDARVQLEGNGEELLPLVGFELSAHPGLALKGPIRSTATVEGLWSAPRFKGRLELDQAALAVAPVLDKPKGVPIVVHFEGRLSGADRVTLSRLDVGLPFVRLEGSGKVDLAQPHRFKVRLATGSVSVARLESAFSAGPLKAGVLKVSLDAKGQWSDWASSRLYGWIELRKGVIHDRRMKDALKDVSLRVQLAGQGVNIERLAFKIRESDIMIKGFMKRLLRNPDIVLTVESSKLDLWRLLVQRDKAHVKTAVKDQPLLDRLRRWSYSSHADVGFLISEARYRRLHFRQLSARLRMGEGRIALNRLSGDTKEGTVAGEASLDFRVPAGADLTGAFEFDGVPVQRVVSLFDPDEDVVRGLLSLTGRVQGTFQEGVPFLGGLRSLDPIVLRIEEGHIIHGRVLPKVLKLLNVPALLSGEVDLDRDGVPFDSLAATVAMKDGVLASEDIRFDSPIVKVSGAGTHNLMTDELDLALAVSPLGAYSDTIGSIPLFGQLLEGDRPGLTTALFDVKGPWHDPDVRYLPMESVAKGLTGYARLAVDVLTNLVTLPSTLTTPPPP
ncbi:MAG: AsmA-like C-terminal domain-containing protein [Nitrospiraceae bacterium]